MSARFRVASERLSRAIARKRELAPEWAKACAETREAERQFAIEWQLERDRANRVRRRGGER